MWRAGAERLPSAWEASGPSLDTWEHLDTSNSADDTPAPARGTIDPAPLGHVPDWRAEGVRTRDRAKAGLVPAIHAAADALAELDPDAPGPAILDRMAEAVAGCREVRTFRNAVCGRHLAQPMSCDVRLCPDCERARNAAYLRRVAGVAGQMARAVFVTLTVPNVPAGYLGMGVDILTDAWSRLRRTALFAGGPCRNPHQDPDDRPTPERATLAPHREACRHAPHREPDARACVACGRRRRLHVDGGCTFAPKSCACPRCVPCRRCVHGAAAGGTAALEVTFSPRTGWHPHLHVVADLPDYLPHAELRDAWRASTCDAYRAAVARDEGYQRSAGYRRPERRPAVKLERCAHLADANGRPADTRCAAGHGWRAVDAERCPHHDRSMAAPCGSRGEPIPEPERCRGASIVWIARARDKDGATAGESAVREAIKYATKGLLGKDGTLAPAITARPELLGEVLLVLRNRRLVNGFGTFHGITDDPDDPAAEPDTVGVDTGELYDRTGATILVRLPRLCPCGCGEALWEYVGRRPRGACLPGPGNRLWYPRDRGGT